jgi:glutamine amidotransferase
MITIINYNAGNLASVKRACDYLNIKSKITSNIKEIINSSKIIFPGVGNAATAINFLKQNKLDSAIIEAFNKGIPILGICLGTQIILSFSEEGNTVCLGIIKGQVKKFNLKNKSLKIPHMGWNEIKVLKEHYLFKDIKPFTQMYFVHSYYPLVDDSSLIVATCEYEIDFPCAICYKNLFAVQFHPEKSGQAGLSIIKNFATWNP